jgi:hypothetical protein
MPRQSTQTPTGRFHVLSTKVTPDFHAWLAEFAQFKETPPIHLIDLALAHFAHARNFKRPPSRTKFPPRPGRARPAHAKAAAAPHPQSGNERSIVISFRVTHAFHVWLGEFADFGLMTALGVIDEALAAFALASGFRTPPRRTKLLSTDRRTSPYKQKTAPPPLGTTLFRQWLTEFADFLGTTGRGVTNEALRRYARASGFRKPPKRTRLNARRRETPGAPAASAPETHP